MVVRPPRLILATNCADRKADTAGDPVRLRDVEGRGPAERARRWAAALRHSQAGMHPADRLYQGDHWSSSIRALGAAAEAGLHTELWVISAGYGLYPAATPIPPYAATFTGGTPDSVYRSSETGIDRSEYLTEWWTALERHVHDRSVGPRSFVSLARSHPDSVIVVVSSGSYLDAVTNDLLAAARELEDPGRLIIVSGGAARRELHPLANHLLPVSAKFQSAVRGTLSALNARVAERMLGDLRGPGDLRFDVLRDRLERWADTLPEQTRYDRAVKDDAEVCAWIRKAARGVDHASASALLRVFRDDGFACEQKRFGRLFARVRAGK